MCKIVSVFNGGGWAFFLQFQSNYKRIGAQTVIYFQFWKNEQSPVSNHNSAS